MFKHSIITCIAIITFVSSFIIGCEGKTKVVDKPTTKVVSKKISDESGSKAAEIENQKVPKNEDPTVALDNIKENNQSNDSGQNEDEDDPEESEVIASDSDSELQEKADSNLNENNEEDSQQDMIPDEIEIKENFGKVDNSFITENDSRSESEKRQAAEELAALHKEGGVGGVYNEETLDLLKNPFLPLFKPEPPSNPDQKPKPRPRPISPIEQVDLSQLKLVATLRAKSGNKALIEDSTGKGYVIEKGSNIGINQGSVVEITNEKVIVEEELESIAGKVKIQRREMKLQKAPGE